MSNSAFTRRLRPDFSRVVGSLLPSTASSAFSGVQRDRTRSGRRLDAMLSRMAAWTSFGAVPGTPQSPPQFLATASSQPDGETSPA
jgi:hypothetical protein